MSLICLVLLSFGGPNASAGINDCRNAARDAKKECNDAYKDADQADKSRSAATGSASGNDINKNCSNMGRDIGQQQGNLSNAQSRCTKALGDCNSRCKPSPTDNPPSSPLYPKEVADIGNEKTGCDTDISPKIAKLASALAGLAKNAGQADACKNQSDSGKPPQMPQIPPSEDKKSEDKKNICESDEGARYSDCNNKFVGKCLNAMSESGCETFAGRYCGAASGGNSVNVSSSKSRGAANLVVDKSGEGLGSGFCKMYSAYRYCQISGRADCPSCRGSYAYTTAECQGDPSKCVPNMSADQLRSAQNSCPTDPIFLDPNIVKAAQQGEGVSNQDTKTGLPAPINPGQSAGSNPAGGTGGGALGGGGASGGSGSGDGGLAGATPEGLPGGNANAINTGGGGGSAQEGLFEEESIDEKGNRVPSSIMPASAVEGLPARDVSNQYGPNLFSISSKIYRDMCAAEKLSTCVKRRK